MFEIGDYIIYGNSGVCEVVEVGPIQLNERDKNETLYYTLEPVFEKGSKIYTPVGNKKVLMRLALNKDEAINLIDNMPNIEFDTELSDKEREQEIKVGLKSIDPEEWIKILKALYYRKCERHADGKKMTSSDEKYVQQAQDYLYGELSISMDIPKEEVSELVSSRLKDVELA